MRSGGPGCDPDGRRRRELHRDRSERQPVVLGLGGHAERRAPVGQELLAVVGRLDVGAGLGEPGEPVVRVGRPRRIVVGRVEVAACERVVRMPEPALRRRPTPQSRRPSTRTRQPPRGPRSRSAGPRRGGRRAGRPLPRPATDARGGRARTNATGSPSAEWFSIERVFTHTPRPSELQPVRPIIPAAVRTTVWLPSGAVERRTVWPPSITSGRSMFWARSAPRPSPAGTATRLHACRWPGGLGVPPLLVHQVVGEDALERHGGALGDAAHLLEQLGRRGLDRRQEARRARGARRRARRPGCPSARPTSASHRSSASRDPAAKHLAMRAAARRGPSPDDVDDQVRGDGHLAGWYRRLRPGPG